MKSVLKKPIFKGLVIGTLSACSGLRSSDQGMLNKKDHDKIMAGHSRLKDIIENNEILREKNAKVFTSEEAINYIAKTAPIPMWINAGAAMFNGYRSVRNSVLYCLGAPIKGAKWVYNQCKKSNSKKNDDIIVEDSTESLPLHGGTSTNMSNRLVVYTAHGLSREARDYKELAQTGKETAKELNIDATSYNETRNCYLPIAQQAEEQTKDLVAYCKKNNTNKVYLLLQSQSTNFLSQMIPGLTKNSIEVKGAILLVPTYKGGHMLNSAPASAAFTILPGCALTKIIAGKADTKEAARVKAAGGVQGILDLHPFSEASSNSTAYLGKHNGCPVTIVSVPQDEQEPLYSHFPTKVANPEVRVVSIESTHDCYQDEAVLNLVSIVMKEDLQR